MKPWDKGACRQCGVEAICRIVLRDDGNPRIDEQGGCAIIIRAVCIQHRDYWRESPRLISELPLAVAV